MFKMQISSKLSKLLKKKSDKNFLRNLSIFLNKVNVKDLDYTLDLLFNNKIQLNILNHQYKRSNFNQSVLNLELSDSKRELHWYVRYFQRFSTEINIFLNVKKDLELAILNSNVDMCFDIITKLEDEITVSYWSIEMYSNLLKEFKKESPAKYINELKKNCEQNKLTYFFLNQILIKSETTNNLNFSDTLLETLNKARNEAHISVVNSRKGLGIVDLISSYLIPFEYDRNRNIYDRSLSTFSSLSIIDQYILFKEFLISKKLYGDKFSEEEENLILEYIESSEDNELINTFSKSVDINNINEVGKEIVRKYSYGDYKFVIDKFKENISQNTNYFTYLDIYVKSLIYSSTNFDDDFLYSKIANSFINIYLVKDNSNESISYLSNIILKFHHLSWTKTITYFLYNFIESKKVDNKFISKILYPYGEFITPKAIENFSYKEFVDKLDINLDLIPKYRKNKFIAKELEIDSKESNSYLLDYKETVVIESEYIKDKCEYLLNENEIEKCIEFVVETYLNNMNTFIFLPIEKLVNSIDVDDIDEVLLDTLILFDIYRKNISLDREEDLNDLYLDYLSYFETHKPSEIYRGKTNLNYKDLYFLEKICITSIMDSSSKFQGNEKLLNERISILNIIESNVSNKITIINEKNSLFLELSSEELKTSYNHGRIFVDITSFRQLRENTYKRLFERYGILCQNNNDIEDLEEYVTYEHINKSEYEDGFIPSTDLFSFIHELYQEHLIKDFVKNQNFGLEKYLSAEIRHGNLRTELRSTLEKYNLITDEIEIENSNREYEDNKYWLKKYEYLDIPAKNNLNKILKKFSITMDKELSKVESWLKIIIDKEANIKDNFDFSPSPERLKKLRIKIKESNNFEEFFNNCIDFMWGETYILINIYKIKLENELKVSITEIFKELKKEVSKDSLVQGFRDILNDIVKAENLFIEELNNVLKWFNRVDDNVDKKFKFSSIISSTYQLFQKIINNDVLEVIYNNKQIPNKNDFDLFYLEARAFMTSILISLYNAKEYGKKFYNKSIIIIDLNIEKNEIIIKNEIEIDENQISFFIEELKKKFSDDKSDLMITEGGSGLHKIYNLLKNTGNKFYVDIDIITEENKKYFCVYLGEINENTYS
ncbi:hypothetical protein ACNO6Z_08605 [Aliarcobacter lanthieri]|uniref:hypothetical protein n=1 Tax=Aliarcobacter lanthieri TaxID=1355374 RepID=UPI003AA87944